MRIPITCMNCGYRVGDIIAGDFDKRKIVFRTFSKPPEQCVELVHVICPNCNYGVAEIAIPDDVGSGNEPPRGYEFGAQEGGETNGRK